MKTDSKDRRSKISDKLRKELGVCSHERVSYKSLEKLNQLLYKRIKSDQKQFKILAEDIRHKNNQLRTFYINTHKNAKKVNEVFDRYKEANDNLGITVIKNFKKIIKK